MTDGSVRVGTRGSTLAMWQARRVAERLQRELQDAVVEIVIVSTRGDRSSGALDASGQIGFFTSDIEQALRDGHVDLAVHSLKDLPVDDADFPVLAVPTRGAPGDALLSREGSSLADLPSGSRVGTSSPRRACLLLATRPDLEIVPARGNVDTRVGHLEEGRYDALVLAVAGLERLGMGARITQRLDPVAFTPAPGQGALAVQGRSEDADLVAAVARIDHAAARRTTTAERCCLASLGGGCARPIGAYARVDGQTFALDAFVGSPDGQTVRRAGSRIEDPEPEMGAVRRLGHEVAMSLLEDGAADLLR